MLLLLKLTIETLYFLKNSSLILYYISLTSGQLVILLCSGERPSILFSTVWIWSGSFVFSVDSPPFACFVVLIGLNIPTMVPLRTTKISSLRFISLKAIVLLGSVDKIALFIIGLVFWLKSCMVLRFYTVEVSFCNLRASPNQRWYAQFHPQTLRSLTRGLEFIHVRSWNPALGYQVLLLLQQRLCVWSTFVLLQIQTLLILWSPMFYHLLRWVLRMPVVRSVDLLMV